MEHLWGTTDAGTSFAGKCYIDVNAHWISEDFKVKKKILIVIKVDSKNAVDYRGHVEDIYEKKCLDKPHIMRRLWMLLLEVKLEMVASHILKVRLVSMLWIVRID